MLRYTGIALGEGGGVCCRGCRAPRPATYAPAADVVAAARAAVAEWTGGAGPNLAFVGPDAFGHPALADVLSSAGAAGAQRIRVDGGGCAVSAGDVAKAMRAGARQLRLTLLGDAQAHEALAGSGSGTHVAAVAAAFGNAGRDAGLQTCTVARVPVCEHNLGALPGAVVWALELGCASVTLEVGDDRIPPEHLVPWLVAACNTGMIGARWVSVAGVDPAILGEYALHAVSTVQSGGER